MNKKFLSAILFGALMVTSTGTFVSCKDYDDDIENLQTQINNLATKSDVEAKLSQLQAAIDAAKAEAIAAAKAADESAEIAALEAEIAALETCKCDVDAMLAKIQAAVDADMAAYAEEINALIEQAQELVGEVADYVTSVELIGSFFYGPSSFWGTDLSFMTAEEKDNVFGKDLPGAITFEKGNQRQTGDSFFVRVSPTNAVITPEMISLVDGEGNTLDEFLKVTSVERYNKQILGDEATPQTRAEGNSGLWTVTVELKKYDKTSFNAATMVKNDGSSTGYSYKRFAVEINNTLSTAAEREVVSSFEIQIMKEPFTPASELHFEAAGIEDCNLKNRIVTGVPEYIWTGDAAVAAVTEGANINVTPGDDRSGSGYVYLSAVQGKKIEIKLTDAAGETPNNIRAMYVTLDKKGNANQSGPSEWNAWNGYTYTGLNTVVEGTSTTITIDSEKAINDYIGFRVYAVNYNGTLVDPDGKAFYVLVGEQADEITAIATSITATSNTLVATEAIEVKALAELGNYKFSWEMDDEDQVPFNLNFVTSDGALNIYSAPDGQKSQVYNINQVLKIAAKPTEPWYEYEDGKTYYGTLKAYKVVDNNEFVAATLKVSFTKNIPTAAPEGFSVKTNQVVNGIYNCYLLPNSTTAETATTGSMLMEQIFNFPSAATQANYSIKFATSQYNADAEAYTDAQTVVGTGAVVVDKKLIDNTSKHVTTATYNYGQVSSVQYAAHEADADVTADYILPVPEVNFETVYNCIYNDTYTFDWATRAQLGTPYTDKDADGNYTTPLPYKTAVTYGDTNFKVSTTHIYGTSAWDSSYNKFLSANTSLAIKSVALTSDANGVEEYFDVTVSGTDLVFTQKSGATNPNAAVPSTLTIKMKDMYGCDKVIKLAITVNKR